VVETPEAFVMCHFCHCCLAQADCSVDLVFGAAAIGDVNDLYSLPNIVRVVK
jgi:hypothetical protein